MPLSTDKRYHVGLVDDHPMVREGMRNLIQGMPDIELVRSCGRAPKERVDGGALAVFSRTPMKPNPLGSEQQVIPGRRHDDMLFLKRLLVFGESDGPSGVAVQRVG